MTRDAGVLEFKQGFNGYVVEMPGDFMKVLRPVTYRAQRLAHKLLGR
jgi:alanine adding enzyme